MVNKTSPWWPSSEQCGNSLAHSSAVMPFPWTLGRSGLYECFSSHVSSYEEQQASRTAEGIVLTELLPFATAVKTLKYKTVAEGRFRHANYIRDLQPYIVDEPPGLLGDDTAPNPSEASLAALGSCIAVGLHANAVHRGITINSLEVELAEQDIKVSK